MEANILKLIKGISEEPVANIVLTGGRLNVFPRRLQTRQRCSLSPLLFSIGLEALVGAVQTEAIKGLADWQANKTAYSQTKVVCLENQEKPTKTLLERIHFSMSLGYKIDNPTSVAFLCTIDKHLENEI